ncbi:MULTISPECIES: hypothetical protein [unclassified Rhizobium]|uniref:hypothetical protein n=1 Tax=unclassified Rhizobium TaxID=2613769 RepID=UPI0007EC2A68|nr:MULTISPECIES: hypothetical protein [unclassified Rhizobium]ANL12045.1 hypothetical protein AMJ98_PA00099 [Rhizobium sp. N1341]ANM42890.1 hypothetical protein AMK03_PA00099 [Rhizobium sp. N741]
MESYDPRATYVDLYETIMPRVGLVYDYRIVHPDSIQLVYADTAGPDDYADWMLYCSLKDGSTRWVVTVDCGEGEQLVKPLQFEEIIAAVDRLNPRIRRLTEKEMRRTQGADR